MNGMEVLIQVTFLDKNKVQIKKINNKQFKPFDSQGETLGDTLLWNCLIFNFYPVCYFKNLLNLDLAL